MRSSLAAAAALMCLCPLAALAQPKPGQQKPPGAAPPETKRPAPAPPPPAAPPPQTGTPAEGAAPPPGTTQPPTGSLPDALPEAPPAADAEEAPADAPAPEPEAPGSDAQAEAESHPTIAVEDDAEPELEIIPPAADTLSGHIAISASGAFVIPFGSLDESFSQQTGLGNGGAVGLDAGLGLSRSVVLGAWAQLGFFGPNEQSFAIGPFVRYHLVQGVRFDPWISAGLGFRTTTVTFRDRSYEYSGIDWLRVQIGGDWYPFKNIGIGPFSELDVGVFGNRPDESKDSALHWFFLMGARVTLDFPGK